MKPEVIVYSKIPEQIFNYIEASCRITYFEELAPQNLNDFMEALHTAKGIMGKKFNIDKKILDFAPNLCIVSTASVGYDRLDIKEITRRKIMATNTPGVLTETVADLVMGLVLATARRIPELDRYVKDGCWKKYVGSHLFGADVHHKTLGIIGMGRIGLAIAKRAYLGFDMQILYHNRSKSLEGERLYDAVFCDLKQLLTDADIICLMAPLTKETDGLIGEKEFKLMKKTAIFINASRGQNVHEEALIQALKFKTIQAAGLDVYTEEPLESHPLFELNNVVTLPHIGSATHETRFAMAKAAADNLICGVTNQRPPNLINPEVWDENSFG